MERLFHRVSEATVNDDSTMGHHVSGVTASPPPPKACMGWGALPHFMGKGLGPLRHIAGGGWQWHLCLFEGDHADAHHWLPGAP